MEGTGNFSDGHDPDSFAGLAADSSDLTTQKHMFAFSMVGSPESWVVSGTANRTVMLLEEDKLSIAKFYIEQQIVIMPLGVAIEFDGTVLQVPGKVWCGIRYFQMYYTGHSDSILGKGHCCVSFSSSDPMLPSFGGQCYCIIRNLVVHQAFCSASCPLVYFFYLEFLSVCESSSDVPLLEATAPGTHYSLGISV